MVFLLLLKLKIPYFYFSSPTFVFSLISFKLLKDIDKIEKITSLLFWE